MTDQKQISFDFGVLFGQARYNSFGGKSLCPEVRDLTFNAKISMAQQRDECQTSLDQLDLFAGNLKIEYCDGFTVADDVESWFTDSWSKVVIHTDVKSKMEGVLRGYFKSYFDCKPYRF